MSKVRQAFARGKAFIPFVTCGDPSLAVTEALVCAMAEAGADLIELGIPFSDPTAEGPVIQAANVRALSGGVTTDKIFDMVKRLRQNTKIPRQNRRAYGIHDLCQRGVLLWGGTVYPHCGGGRHGRADPARSAV